VSEISASAGKTQGTRAERLLFAALIALVALAPLPLASNRPLPAAALSLAAGLLLALWGAALLAGHARLAVSPRRIAWPLALSGAVALWIVIQTLPLPAGWGDPAWTEAAAALGEPLSESISVNPQATLTALMRLLAYAAILWLTMQLARAPERARTALKAAALTGAAYAAYGIAIYAAGNDWVTIYRKWSYHQALTSTFVNRNSYATFAGLGLLCAAAWFMGGIRHLIELKRPLRHKAALLAEAVFTQSLVRSAAMLLLLAALFLTGSRAGVAASLIGLFVLLTAMAGGGARRPMRIAVAGGITGVLALAALALGGGLLSERLAETGRDASAADRQLTYAATMDAITTAPWTGTGYGTYREVFAAWRPEPLSSGFFWDKAHNDYLENALELGLPAALALNLAIALLALEALRGLGRRRDRTAAALGVAATALVAVHAYFDFSLQMPAVSAFYAFIMGLAVAQSYPHARRRDG
jgi:O-antigen ligase